MIFLKRRAFMTFKFNYETSKGIKQVILTNCGQAPFKRFSILGNSHQDSTTGKQLFDVSALKNISGFSVDEDGFIMQKVYDTTSPKTLKELIPSIEAGKSYYLSVDNPDDFTGFFGFTGSVSVWYKNQTFVPKEDDLNIRPGIVSKVGGNARYRLMITEGQTASPYEPYTGGKPSPSHDYPQQIKNVGKWDEEKQKYEVDVRVTGKNLFDKEYAKRKDAWKLPNDGYPYIPIYVGKGKRITVSTSGNPKIGLNFYCTIARTTSNTSRNFYTWIYHSTIENLIKTKATFYAIESDYIYFSLSGGVNNIEKFLSAFPDFQIEYGEERTDYEPHKEQTLTLTSDRPITKWDKLEKRDGQIGWLYKSKVYDSFDGQNNKIALANKVGNVQHFSVDFINALDGQAQANSYCDKYKGVNYSYIKEEYGIFCDWNGGVKYFSAPNDKVTNLQEFKVWLIKNPLDLAYETLETEFIPLPQSEQDAIRALTTYHPTTVITVDGGDVDAGIEVEYATKNKE